MCADEEKEAHIGLHSGCSRSQMIPRSTAKQSYSTSDALKVGPCCGMSPPWRKFALINIFSPLYRWMILTAVLQLLPVHDSALMLSVLFPGLGR